MRKFKNSILELLVSNPSTIKEVAEALNISTRTARDTLVKLNTEHRIFIHRYNRNPTGGFPQAVYRLGKGKNVDKPIPTTPSERRKKNYQKHIAKRTLMRHARRGKLNMFSQLMVFS